MKMQHALPLLGISFALLTGCSSSVKIHALEPAKIDRAAKTKVIAVLPFRNDSVGLAEKLEATLANKQVEGKPFFTLVSRSQIQSILNEQKLQFSGLINENTTVRVGQLMGAQALIDGQVDRPDTQYTYYREERSACADKDCTKMRLYTVSCTRMNSSLSATLRMSDVEKGDVIHIKNFSDSASHSACRDESQGLPSESQIYARLAQRFAEHFTRDISPNAIAFEVELLDSPQIPYTSEQKQLLNAAIEQIEAGRLDRAEEQLSQLLTSTGDRSIVAAYNLGVVKEALGEIDQAAQLYRLADQLSLKPQEEINQALKRIQKTLSDRERLKTQL